MLKTIANYFKKSLRTPSLILAFVLFVFVFNFLYNQERGALASEYKTRCETFIPIGHAIDETQETAGQIADDLEIILDESEKQISEAKKMIAFANGCHRIETEDGIEYNISRCSTGCNEYTYDCNPYDCNCVTSCSIDPVTGQEECEESCDTCYETCYACEVLSCTGNACDFDGITKGQDNIEKNYDKINKSQENIENTIEKVYREKRIFPKDPPTIIELVRASKAGLEYCAGFVRTIEGMTPEEIDRSIKRREIKMLLSCDSAKTVDPGIKCHFNDFFCCG